MFNASGFLSARPEKGLKEKIMTDVKNLKWSSLLQTKQRKQYMLRNFVVFFHCYLSLMNDGVVLNG